MCWKFLKTSSLFKKKIATQLDSSKCFEVRHRKKYIILKDTSSLQNKELNVITFQNIFVTQLDPYK